VWRCDGRHGRQGRARRGGERQRRRRRRVASSSQLQGAAGARGGAAQRRHQRRPGGDTAALHAVRPAAQRQCARAVQSPRGAAPSACRAPPLSPARRVPTARRSSRSTARTARRPTRRVCAGCGSSISLHAAFAATCWKRTCNSSNSRSTAVSHPPSSPPGVDCGSCIASATSLTARLRKRSAATY
jgi:hypothetical protein